MLNKDSRTIQYIPKQTPLRFGARQIATVQGGTYSCQIQNSIAKYIKKNMGPIQVTS